MSEGETTSLRRPHHTLRSTAACRLQRPGVGPARQGTGERGPHAPRAPAARALHAAHIGVSTEGVALSHGTHLGEAPSSQPLPIQTGLRKVKQRASLPGFPGLPHLRPLGPATPPPHGRTPPTSTTCALGGSEQNPRSKRT